LKGVENKKAIINNEEVTNEKRVPANVAAKYDYFHDELVKNLAGGDASKLGIVT
jgi:hypothetical protein